MENREIWLDYVRALAAVLVVLLHTSASYLYKIENIDLTSWLSANYVDSFTRVSVPLFFMISGYLFFRDKKPKARNFIRIILALLFYSGFSLIYLKFYRNIPILGLVKGMAFQPVFYHLWFFYTIIIIYTFATFITIRDTQKHYVLLMAFICFVVINQKLSDLSSLAGFTYKSRLQLDGTIIYYFLFAIFGAIIGNIKSINNNFIARYFAPALYVTTSILIGYGTFVISTSAGKYIDKFHSYSCVLVAIGSISIFIWIKDNNEIFRFLGKQIQSLSRNSLAIYGIHAIILDIINKSGYRNYNNPIVDIPAVFCVTILVSFLFAKLIKYFDKNSLIT